MTWREPKVSIAIRWGFATAMEGEFPIGYALGNIALMLKPVSDGWNARPSAELNPRFRPLGSRIRCKRKEN